MNQFHYYPVSAAPLAPCKYHKAQKLSEGQKADFTETLQKEINKAAGLTLSKHAQERLQQRDIRIDASQWQQISEKVKEAKKKGVTDSLVLLDQAALIVSAKNETVITAMNRKEAASHIFTNIDGTILLD